MNSKYITPLLFAILLLYSCNTSPEKMIIGQWLVEEIEVNGQISLLEQEDLQRMEGATISFKNDNVVQIELEGELHETQWSFNENVIDIKNGSQFIIEDINHISMTLKSKLSYYEDNELVEYHFTQIMSKVQQQD